jgi:CubicO group peptidase (beta-lactamase class C family)
MVSMADALARLMARGMVDLEAPLAVCLPEIPMHPAFAAMPLRAVLRHEAGIRRDPHWSVFARLRASRVSLREQRRHMAALALAEAPVASAGYSNLGYIVLGAVVEAATGMRWEEVVSREVFGPLGMADAGFGAPVLPASVGHRAREGRWRPVAPGSYADNPRVYAPAGGVHLPLGDWARFAAMHLGDVPGYLPDALLHRLHDPGAGGYAAGWGTGRTAAGEPLLRHTGSNTMWFADIRLLPARGIAVAVACNAESRAVRARVLRFTDRLLADASKSDADAVVLGPKQGRARHDR